MRGRARPWAWYLLAWIVAVVIDRTVAPGPLGVLGVAIELSGSLAVLAGTRLHRPAHPLPWYLVASAIACYSAGDALIVLAPAGQPLREVVSGFLLLAPYPLVLAALVLFGRGRQRGARPFEALDAGIFTVSAGLLCWVFLIEPTWSLVGAIDGGHLSVGFPIGNTLLLAGFLRLAQTRGPGRAASHAIATVFGAVLVVQAVAIGSSADGGLLYVHPDVVDAWWMLAFPVVGTFALHPSMPRFAAPAPREGPPQHTIQILALMVALLAPPSVLLGQLAAGAPLSLVPVLACSSVLVTLGSIRMVLLVKQVNAQATTDDLTGLPNRRAFYATVTARLADRAVPRALLVLDLDRFKDVNDALGHQAGDALLVQVAARLGTQVGRKDVLARLGGDEFAILLEDVGRDGAHRVASMITAAMAEPFEVDALAVHSGASIGISLFPEHATELSTLLRRSDIAMYQAKASGGPTTYGGGSEDDGRVLRLAAEFRSALLAHELLLHYQPKLDLITGEVLGVEALVRWQHPTEGLLYPAAFLSCLQDAGLMRALTQAVLTLALDQTSVWARSTPMTVAVNLSASSLSDVDLRREVSEMLADRGLPASALRLEITEEFLMADKTRARVILGSLCDAGISISVDDFGTGYSSLAYLRDLPIDELKLDMSFVSPMATDPRAAALVSSTIGLAHSLGLRMVAEGVEDGATCAELARLGCDEVQGYFVSRPLPADELDAWLAARSAARSTAQPRARHARAPYVPTQAAAAPGAGLGVAHDWRHLSLDRETDQRRPRLR